MRCSPSLLSCFCCSDESINRYDETSELAQAKRDCIALAEEVQRLRSEVEKERTGRKKALAAKKQAEADRDDAVARLVALQGGRPMAMVEEGAPPDAATVSSRIPEGDTTAGLGETDSLGDFERAEAEAWGGKHRSHRNLRLTLELRFCAANLQLYQLPGCVNMPCPVCCEIVQMGSLAICQLSRRRRLTQQLPKRQSKLLPLSLRLLVVGKR